MISNRQVVVVMVGVAGLAAMALMTIPAYTGMLVAAGNEGSYAWAYHTYGKEKADAMWHNGELCCPTRAEIQSALDSGVGDYAVPIMDAFGNVVTSE